MASIRALSVELLESILVHLEMKDLLRIQRVSQHWRDVVRSSPHIQRLLFLGFVPRDGDFARFVQNNVPRIRAKERSMEGGHRKHQPPLASGRGVSSESIRPAVVFNPIFPSQGGIIRMQTLQFREGLGSTSSWLDMYLTQPPVSYPHVTVYFTPKPVRQMGLTLTRLSRQTAAADVLVRRCGGVRARDILEELQKLNVANSRKWQRLDISIPEVSRVGEEERRRSGSW